MVEKRKKQRSNVRRFHREAENVVFAVVLLLLGFAVGV